MTIPRLTKKQREILDFIETSSAKQGYAPSYREIADHFELSSVATVHEHVRNLAEKGCLTVDDNEARSLQVIAPAADAFDGVVIPLAGVITAGEPIEAIEEPETITIPPVFVRGGKEHFALRVKGESMIEDGILDGDVVILERCDRANNGDIVVALLENEYATLKRWYRERDHIRLQPANATMEPLRVPNAIVQGKVVGLIRKYR